MDIVKLLYFDTTNNMIGGSANNKGTVNNKNGSNNNNGIDNKGTSNNNNGNANNNKGNANNNKGNANNNKGNANNNKGNANNNKGNANNNKGNANNNKGNNNVDNSLENEYSGNEKSLLSSQFEIFEELKTVFINTYNWLKDGLLTWVLIPIMFGSVAPAMPFLIFMAIMFAIMKFLMGIFRNL